MTVSQLLAFKTKSVNKLALNIQKTIEFIFRNYFSWIYPVISLRLSCHKFHSVFLKNEINKRNFDCLQTFWNFIHITKILFEVDEWSNIRGKRELLLHFHIEWKYVETHELSTNVLWLYHTYFITWSLFDCEFHCHELEYNKFAWNILFIRNCLLNLAN